jgi:hypothetical protein
MLQVRVLPGEPFLIFDSREDQVERFSVSRLDTYRVDPTVRKHHFQQFRLFHRILSNVQKIGLVREF